MGRLSELFVLSEGWRKGRDGGREHVGTLASYSPRNALTSPHPVLSLSWFDLFSFRSYPPAAAAAAKSLQSCPTLCDPIDGSPPGSPVPGILQARAVEWLAIAFSTYPLTLKVKKLTGAFASLSRSDSSWVAKQGLEPRPAGWRTSPAVLESRAPSARLCARHCPERFPCIRSISSQPGRCGNCC